MIGFVGSVFSPYYARARRRGAGDGGADPLAHCAINVALYRDEWPLWTMTERGAGAVERRPDRLQVGPSALQWRDGALTVTVDEWSVPLPRRVRGTVRVVPRMGLGAPAPIALDRNARHQWWPVAPHADVEVDFDRPGWRWRGRGYVDSNRGVEPLERAFADWHWARVHLDDDACGVVYDTRQRDGSAASMALRLRDGHGPEPLPPLAMLELPRGRWGVARRMRGDAGSPVRGIRSLEDGPFYTRSLLAATWHGRPVVAMHESLSLDRFVRRSTQAMLPWRMPRRA